MLPPQKECCYKNNTDKDIGSSTENNYISSQNFKQVKNR